MVLYALVAVELPNANASERLAFAHALQRANYSYGRAAHTFWIDFVASLDEAREYLADPEFQEEPDFTFEDHVQMNANIAADRDAAAERIREDVEAAAVAAGARHWNIDIQISEQRAVSFSSND